MIGALGDRKRGAPRSLGQLAGAEEDLPGDQERDEDVDCSMEVLVAADEIVLVTTVRVAGTVGVVLEDEDLAPDPLLLETLLGPADQSLEDPLPCLVVGDDVLEGVALGGGELGMGSDVEIEPGAVLEKDVGRPPPGHHPTEEISGDLVRAEPSLPPKGAGDPVLVLDPEDASIHLSRLNRHQPVWRDESQEVVSSDGSSRRNVLGPLEVSRTAASQPSLSRPSAWRNTSAPTSNASVRVNPSRQSSPRAVVSCSALPPMATKLRSSKRSRRR